MTKRHKAAYHRYARLERELSARHIPDGDEVAELLERLAPFRPVMLVHADVRCKACDIITQVGDTVFVTDVAARPGPVLCCRCGIAWEISKRRLDINDALDIPPFGGPKP